MLQVVGEAIRYEDVALNLQKRILEARQGHAGNEQVLAARAGLPVARVRHCLESARENKCANLSGKEWDRLLGACGINWQNVLMEEPFNQGNLGIRQILQTSSNFYLWASKRYIESDKV